MGNCGGKECWESVGTSPWPETAKGGNFVARHMSYYCHVCLSSVMCCQLRNVQSDCVQDVTDLVCGVDVIDPGTWMRGKPDLAKRSVASMRWFKKRRPI